MKSSLIALFVVAFGGAACASNPSVATSAPAEKPKATTPPTKTSAAAPVAPAEAAQATAAPVVGDYTVHRFSGAYRKKPMWLKEQLVEREGEVSTLEITVDEEGATRVLRVVKVGADTFSVVRVDGGRSEELDARDYDTLMETTSFAADTNEGLVDTEPVTLIVGGREISGTKTRFKVTVNGKDGILAVVTSDGMPGRDLSGELTLGDGTVVYRASLIESGNEAPSSSFASRF